MIDRDYTLTYAQRFQLIAGQLLYPTPHARAVALALAASAVPLDTQGMQATVVAPTELLATATGLPWQTVIRALDDLDKIGYARPDDRPGRPQAALVLDTTGLPYRVDPVADGPAVVTP